MNMRWALGVWREAYNTPSAMHQAPSKNSQIMLKNHIKTAFRNLFRHKRNALIIILSLTVAFSFSNILLSFVIYELNTDGFHKHKNRIYRLISDDPFEEGKQLRYVTREAANFIQTNFPEIEASTFVSKFDHKGVGQEETFQNVTVLATDAAFFTLFDYQLIEGNPKTAIQPDGMVLTASAAGNLLDQRPYVGQTIEMALDSGTHLFNVTGIVADPSENTQLQFDALILSNQIGNQWGGSAYLLLSPKADAESLVAKINQNEEVPSLVRPGAVDYDLSLLQDTYFSEVKPLPYEQGRNQLLVWICWGVVFLISFAASFNFINLFIISLIHRKKEMGVRKVLGASRGNLGLGLGVEVGLYIGISLVFSALFTVQILPWFNLSFNTSLSLTYLTNENVLLAIGGLVLMLGLFITLYLVYFSWRLHPIRLLSKNVVEKVKINRLLIGAQFFIAMGMMVCAAVVIGQMQYIQNKPLGFNRDLMQVDPPSDKEEKEKLPVLKQQLLQYPEFSSIALSLGNPISGNAIIRYELEDSTFYGAYFIAGDYDLIKTMHLEVIEGKPFRPGFSSGKLVNETFVRHFHMDAPIGVTIPGTEGNKNGPDKIIGVVKDFNVVSFKQEIPPYIISYSETPDHLLIDISGKKLSTILPFIEKSWQEIYPGETFSYKLIDNELMAKHKEDTLFFRMIISFTIASVLISCFGLFGIAAFTAVQRTKEIGIRKVLGASVSSILVLLSKDFVKLIFIAFILAIPVANYFMSEWLQNFAYKIEISWWMFIIPGLVVLLIALLSMVGQTLKAAHTNPVESLRNE